MHWKDAIRKTGAAFRLLPDGKRVVRFRAGDAWVAAPGSTFGFRCADAADVDGYEDWEPLEKR